MDYEKKYPITQQPGDFVLVQWERGYKYVEVFYNDHLVGSVEGVARLRKGTVLKHEQLGNILLKLSEKPMVLDAIIDGYHSPANQSHPKKELAKLAPFFWIIMTFSVIGALLDGMSIGVGMDLSIGTIVTLINILIIATYIIAAIFVGKSQPWAYYMGFSVFSLMTVLTVFGVLFVGLSGMDIISLLFRFAFLGVLIYNMKTANGALRHARFGMPMNDELLDS